MTVPPYDWQVPIGADVPNVPFDITRLATDIAATMQQVEEALSRLPYAMAVGSISDGVVSGPKDYPIVFPAGRFTSTPRVYCQPYLGEFGETSVKTVSTSGATITVTHPDGGSGSLIVRVYWMAVQ